MQHRMPTLLTSLAIGITFAGAALVLIGSEAKARPVAVTPMGAEVIYDAASPKVKTAFDKLASSAKPTAAEVKQSVATFRGLMATNELRTGTDYVLASAVVSKSDSIQDAMLAHDLAVCALALGNKQAKPLVAVSQDLLLARLGQKQRFGTLAKDGVIEPVEKEVPDSMRFILGLPSLREAKKLVALGKPFSPSINSGIPVMHMAQVERVAVAVTK